jgi:hypothetical protein
MDGDPVRATILPPADYGTEWRMEIEDSIHEGQRLRRQAVDGLRWVTSHDSYPQMRTKWVADFICVRAFLVASNELTQPAIVR